MKKCLGVFLILCASAGVWAAEVKELPLRACESAALEFSPAVKAAQAQAAPARHLRTPRSSFLSGFDFAQYAD